MIISSGGMWDDLRLADCDSWLVTVVCSPRKAEIVLHDVQGVLQDDIPRQRAELKNLAAAE